MHVWQNPGWIKLKCGENCLRSNWRITKNHHHGQEDFNRLDWDGQILLPLNLSISFHYHLRKRVRGFQRKILDSMILHLFSKLLF